ncbi:MAG: tetratricopeptide repeat protein [Planctomycetes bacterium]|nr:tetratricopeptide repeat protein [Planctomycetota bacterium]
MARAAVYLLFFLSGASALVCEVAWTRRLVLLLGSTTIVVSLILAAWMLGLAIGARLFGGLADRSKHPLRLYAILEAGVAGLVFLFPALLAFAGAAGGSSRIATGLLAFAALLLPTTLMGGTLPVLARFVVRSLGGLGSRIGLLYGLNTFGAVAGTALAGFVLVRHVGVYGSTYAAGAMNLAIAGAALLLARRQTAAPPEASGPTPQAAPTLALAAACASGFVALASETLWTRMLVFFLEGFTFTFAAMLSTFLAGLALGAVLSGAVVHRVKNLRAYVGLLFLLLAVVSAGVLFALTRQLDLTRFAKGLADRLFADWKTVHAASLFVASFAVLFPPALVMGGIFPAVVRMAAADPARLGRVVGGVSAASTLGSVAGALLAGLVLVPLAGMARGAVVILAVSGVTGLLLLGWRRLLPALPLLAGAVLLVALSRPTTPFILHSHVFRGERGLERELTSSIEGLDGAVSVVEDRRNGVRAIYTDAFEAAATGPQYKYMRLLAHLPLLLAPKGAGAEVLVICFGTGTTAGSASLHPLGRLDVVEIAKDVLALAPRFADVNRGIAGGAPRPYPVGIHVADGRNFLRNTERRYDVITLEPLMPYTPGAVHLYTEDFYRLGRARLGPGGVMVQWIPIHAMSSDSYRMLLATFVAVFPEASLWFVEGTSMLVGSAEPLPIDAARMAERARAEGVAGDLRAISFADPCQILGAYVTGGEPLRRALAGARVMTDERPEMEFRAIPVGFASTFLADNLAVLHALRRPVSEIADLAGVPEGDREGFRQSLDAAFEGGQSFLEAEHHMARAGYFDAVKDREQQRDALVSALEAYDRAVTWNPEDASAGYLRTNARYGWAISLGMRHCADRRFVEAEKEFRRAAAMGNAFKRDLAHAWLGRALNRQGRYEAALAALAEALAIFPRSPLARAERAFALAKLGRFVEAREAMPDEPPPDSDPELVALLKELLRRAETGGLGSAPPAPPPTDLPALLDALRRGEGGGDAAARLVTERLRDPAAFRSALAADVARARDPSATVPEQLFALRVFLAAGDVGGAVDLLATGARAVRETAADRLALVRSRTVILPLIAAMEDPDRGVREAAMAAVFGLTGRREPGYAPDGLAEHRAKAVAALREWWEQAGPRFEFR